MSSTKTYANISTKSKASASKPVLAMKLSLDKKNSTEDKDIALLENQNHSDRPVKNSASLWSNTLQTRLKIGTPGGKQEKEADSMAEKVINNTGLNQTSKNSNNDINKKEEEELQAKPIQKQEEEEIQEKNIQRQEEKELQTKPIQLKEEEELQAKPIQKQEEDEVQEKNIQRQEDEELQTKPIQLKEEEKLQVKLIQKQEEEEVQEKNIQRQEDEELQNKPIQLKEEEELQVKLIQKQEEEEVQEKNIQRKEDEELQNKPIQLKEEEELQVKLIQKQEEEEVQEKNIQRKEDEELQTKPLQLKEEEELQAKPIQKQEEEEIQEKNIQRKAETQAAEIHSRLNTSSTSGKTLPDKIQSNMGSQFSADLSNVRVHTDSDAVKMNQQLNAQAFTNKNNIYFNQGKYNPESTEGKRLLAHELTHTIQQGAVNTETQEKQVLADQNKTDIHVEKPELEGSKPSGSAPEKPLKTDIEPSDQAIKTSLPLSIVSDERSKSPRVKQDNGETQIDKPGEGGGEEGEQANVTVIKIPFPDVKKDLEKASKHVGSAAAKKAELLAKNEKTHDDASTKQSQAEQAVVPPENEGQAQSNSGQIDALDNKKVPQANEKRAKDELNSAIDKLVPKTLGDLKDFKSNSSARNIGKQVSSAVTKEVNEVEGAYNEIENLPSPAEPSSQVIDVPEIEIAPETPNLDLGKDAVPGLQEAHTDFKAFEDESDNALKKEGITDEELDMVDSGDLVEARNERKGIKTKVQEEPSKIKQYASGEQKQVDKDLKTEENINRKSMTDKRKTGLLETQKKQKGTKSEIEKKREQVTIHINSIYEKAKTKIKGQLDSLEKESLKRFDTEQEKFSNEFENDVNADINKWKKQRYSGAFGWIKKGKDWLCGIDDFPEVKAAFEKAKKNFVKKIDTLIVQITNDNKKVIEQCKGELSSARKEIKKYVSGLGPELKKTGEKAMKDMQTKLDELDKHIDKKKEELHSKLLAKKDEAIQKIDKKIEEMKEAMSGALSKLVGMLLDAMLKFFKWVLAKFGMDEGGLMKVLEKGARTIKKIVLHPIDFIMNLVTGVGMGIKNFGTNIKKHLITGVVEWLTGSLGGVGIQLPDKWDLKGILYLVLQILGLTWESIRAKLVKHLGEKTVKMAETTVDIVKRLITEGPMGLWEMIEEKAAEIKQSVMDGIKNWLVTNIVKQGLIMLVSFLTPAGAIVQAIKAIYNVIMFFVDNWSRIVEFVSTVFSAITDIAFGKLGAVAAAVEKGLAMIIPMILDFLAKLLNLGGITKAIKNIIKKIRKPIDNVVNKVIKFIVKKAKSLFKKGKTAAKKVTAKILDWWSAKKSFKNKSGESHTLYFKGKGKSSKLMMKSSPTPIENYVNELEKSATSEKDKATIIKIRAEMPNINTYKAMPNPDPKKIHVAFKIIAGLASTISVGSNFGEESNPYPLIWPKRACNAYPTLYLGPKFKDSTVVKQSELMALEGKNQSEATALNPGLTAQVSEWHNVTAYKPVSGKTLPDGSKTIGITNSDFQIRSGMKFQLPSTEQSTPGGGKLISQLNKFGFGFSNENVDADHVREIQVGGIDDLVNLWPLNASENRSGGSTLSKIKFSTGENMSALKKKAAKKQPVWLQIKSTKPSSG